MIPCVINKYLYSNLLYHLRFTINNIYSKLFNMNNIFRGLIAGWGASKLGGGCFGTIVVFVIIWYALGHC